MVSARTLPWIVSAALLLAGGSVWAADGEPIEIRIGVADRSRLEELSRLVSIYNVRDAVAYAVASPAQLEALAAAGFSWTSAPKTAVAAAVMCPAGWVDDPARSWDCYPSYGQYTALMHGLADGFPTLCRVESLGGTANLDRSHELWIMRISDNPDLEEAEPEVLLTSTMHGDEATGFVLTLRLIAELLDGYGVDPEITRLVDELEIWINPNANPDATYFGGDHTVDGSIRFYTTASGANSGVDPNRNFPDPDEGDHPDGNPWWPETEAMMDFAANHTTTLSANLHDGVEVVNYPWDTWSRRHVDDDLLIAISRDYADRAQAASPPGYMTDFSNGVTNGWDWYPVAGGRQDFMTFWHSDREVTIELSSVETPPAAQLDDLWSWNRDALISFIGQALTGIHGVVTDPDGHPLDAVVELVGRDGGPDNSSVRTDPDVGDYHRLTLPGSFSIRFSAAGHVGQRYDGIVVDDDRPATLNVVLQPVRVPLTGSVRTPAFSSPVAGATVEIVGQGQTTTDGEGMFSIDEVAVGERTIRISAEGFQSVERSLTVIEDGEPIEISMPPLHFKRIQVMESIDTR